jgi:hypothetical protein
MSALAPIAPKLAKLFPMLSTESAGECLATVAAIKRTLAGQGLTVHDLASMFDDEPEPHEQRRSPSYGPPVWARLSEADRLAWLRVVLNVSDVDTWQHQFCDGVASLIAAGRYLTSKQNAAAQSVLSDAWNRGLRT